MKIAVWGSVIFVALAAAFVAGGWWIGITNRETPGQSKSEVTYRRQILDNDLIQVWGIVEDVNSDQLIMGSGQSQEILYWDEQTEIFMVDKHDAAATPAGVNDRSLVKRSEEISAVFHLPSKRLITVLTYQQ